MKTLQAQLTAASPQPWTYVPGKGIEDADGALIASTAYGGRRISSRVTDEEQEANARLMEYAPRTVALLLAVVARLDGCEWDSDTAAGIADLLRDHGFRIREPR